MQTILIVLNPAKLTNPDLDLCYCVPEEIETVSKNTIQDNGYDYLDADEGDAIGIWLATEDAGANWPIIRHLFQEKKFNGNDLSASAEIYISENDTDALENCRRVFPE